MLKKKKKPRQPEQPLIAIPLHQEPQHHQNPPVAGGYVADV